MPFVLESSAYSIGYVVGQVIGFAILVAIPAGIAYAIYRWTRKKPATTFSPPAGSAQDGPPPEGRSCPKCRNHSQPGKVYCRNCGYQLLPIF
jgi:hypothetical protein